MRNLKVYDCLFALLIITIVIGIRFAEVSGCSMENTLSDDDFLIVNKFDRHYSKGDIIVFDSDNLDEYLIKRVIGTEGDTISFKPNGVLLNNELLHEDYIKTQDVFYTSDEDEYTIDKNQYFVMGDNRNNSLDSRRKEVGIVNSNKIIGKVVLNITDITGLTASKIFIGLKCIVIICLVLIVIGRSISHSY